MVGRVMKNFLFYKGWWHSVLAGMVCGVVSTVTLQMPGVWPSYIGGILTGFLIGFVILRDTT